MAVKGNLFSLKQSWPPRVDWFALLPGEWKTVAVKGNLSALKQDWPLQVEWFAQ